MECNESGSFPGLIYKTEKQTFEPYKPGVSTISVPLCFYSASGHGRLAAALAIWAPLAPPPPPPRRRLLHRLSISGRGAEPGGGEGDGVGWPLLRAVQRELRPSRSAHRRAAEDARLSGSTLPPRHTRGEDPVRGLCKGSVWCHRKKNAASGGVVGIGRNPL